MTKIINIRDNDAREALYAQGWRWALTLPRGNDKGAIVSKHRTYDAANKAARGRELMISDLGERHQVPYILHIPGERPRALRWTTAHPASSYGGGVLLFGKSSELLDGATFRALRDGRGARLETDRPDRARSALALMQDESLG